MLEKYRPALASLTAEQLALVAQRVSRRHRIEISAASGEELFDALHEAGVGQHDVVLAVAPADGPDAETILETIAGRPIQHVAPGMTAERLARTESARVEPRVVAKGAAVRRDDPRRIAYVAETNPKKPGSAAHAKFALYRVGMTVSEFIAAGGTTADVKWDTERGFVRLEDE